MKERNACYIRCPAISWSARRYGNTTVNKNIRHIYVIWFEQKLKWFQFKTEVKDQSFSEDACVNALRKFGLKLDRSD